MMHVLHGKSVKALKNKEIQPGTEQGLDVDEQKRI
jgi:hypothetical protein